MGAGQVFFQMRYFIPYLHPAENNKQKKKKKEENW